MASTLDRIAHEAGRLLKFVAALLTQDDGPRNFVGSLGWELPPGVNDLGFAALDLTAVVRKFDALEAAQSANADDAELAAKFADLLDEVIRTVSALRATIAGFTATGDYLDKTHIKSEFLPRLSGLMTASRLSSTSPAAFLLLQFFGVINVRHFQADHSIFQTDHMRVTFDWSALGRLFTDPVGLLESRYGWGTADFLGQEFVTNLGAVLEVFGEPVRLRQLPRRVEEQLAGAMVPEADVSPATQLLFSIDRSFDASGGRDVGLSLYPLRASAPGATDAGLAIAPYAHGAETLSFELAPQVTLEFDSTVALDSGVALAFRPGQPAKLKGGLLGDGGVVDSIDGHALVRVIVSAPSGERLTLLSFPGGGILDVDSIAFAAGIEATHGNLSPSFAAKLTGGRAAIKPGESDSFLSSILPANGVELKFDLGVRWSASEGVTFEGSASAAIDFPLHFSIGPLRIDGLHVALSPSESGIGVETSFAASTSLGPLTVTVDRVGAQALLAFHDGNLGPIDVALDFKPPSGIGLALDISGVASGGGFLFHDAATSTYAGVLQLSIYDVLTVTAFGLIATRMPDGSRGYSLVVFITADDFRPIQLGLGFTLLGIGGMVGINRTFDENVLREGIKNDTLGTLLFPRDPVRNAPAIIGALASAFPARLGSYLVGLLAKIGWFTPTLVLMQIAIIVEFGVRKRLLLLGRVSSLLPSPDNDLVRINVDVVGVIDFDQGNVAVDGMLVDSRLAHAYALTGAMALRARWGSGPGSTFVLAVGGLHPRFTPPSDLPKLARVAIAFSSGNNPRLTCESYFAITANTIQFGARAQLYAAAYGFSIEGDIGYDVLIEIAPLHFIADFDAKVQLKHGSSNLFSVAVKGELEGPRPLRVSGKASFSIFWCDFSVRFDKTLVEGEKPPLPAAVDLLAQLKQALADTTSWSVQTRSAHGVALRKLTSTKLILDPLGMLVVRQQIVPLNTTRDIDLYGGAPVSGARRFHIDAALQAQGQHVDPVRGQFSPAQYFALSDDEKLAAPSFDEMDCGIMFGGDAARFEEVVPAPLIYESLVIDTVPQPANRDPHYTLLANQLMLHTRTGAVARAPLRNTGAARFRVADAPKAAALTSLRFRIVPFDEGAPA
ncbi:MAG TPA: DUF6603 domain-containing protein, partial [Casimicrobiaceae bacterium]